MKIMVGCEDVNKKEEMVEYYNKLKENGFVVNKLRFPIKYDLKGRGWGAEFSIENLNTLDDLCRIIDIIQYPVVFKRARYLDENNHYVDEDDFEIDIERWYEEWKEK